MWRTAKIPAWYIRNITFLAAGVADAGLPATGSPTPGAIFTQAGKCPLPGLAGSPAATFHPQPNASAVQRPGACLTLQHVGS